MKQVSWNRRKTLYALNPRFLYEPGFLEVLLICAHLLKNLRTQPDYHLDDEAFIRRSEKGIFL